MIPGIDAALIPDLKIVLDRTKNKLMDRLTARQYQLVSRAIDRVSALLDEPSPKEAYDADLAARVKAILDASPEHQNMLKRFEQDRILREAAFYHLHFLEHSLWETWPDWFRKMVTEPPTGKFDQSAWDAWVDSNRSNRLQGAYDELGRQTDLLNTTHERFMARIRRANTAKPLIFRGGGVAEELPQ